MKLAISGTTLFVLALLMPQTVFAQTDPMLGNWRLNVAKSTYSPGPAPRSQTWNIIPAGQGMTLNLEGVGAQGGQVKQTVTLIFDSQPHPMTGNANFDSITSRHIDLYTAQGNYLKGGNQVGNWTSVITRDAKVLTLTSSGRGANGGEFNNVVVFERQ